TISTSPYLYIATLLRLSTRACCDSRVNVAPGRRCLASPRGPARERPAASHGAPIHLCKPPKYFYTGAMPQSLSRHPESRCVAATRVEVEVLRQGAGTLLLSYAVYGNIGELRLPPISAPARRPDLWQQTCFEAFVGTAAGAAYYEFNFAPSSQWAAYRFSSYRNGMSVATEITPPDIEVHSAPGRYTLQAALNPHE